MNLGAKCRHGIGYIKSTKRSEFKLSEFEEKLIGGGLYIVFSYVRTRIEITLVYLKQEFIHLVLCNKIEINIRFSLCYVLIVNES